MEPTDKDITRFNSKFTKGTEDECWIWNATKDSDGYGRIKIQGKSKIATHVAFYLKEHRWPETGKLICHSCDNPSCVNPKHLREDTHAGNHAERNLKNRQAYGSKNGTAILTEEQVLQIVELYNQQIPLKEIADQFGVSLGPIQGIISGIHWTHITGGKLEKRKYHTNSKLTEEQVREIRQLCANGESQGSVGKKYGIIQTTVGKIVRGERYQWVK